MCNGMQIMILNMLTRYGRLFFTRADRERDANPKGDADKTQKKKKKKKKKGFYSDDESSSSSSSSSSESEEEEDDDDDEVSFYVCLSMSLLRSGLISMRSLSRAHIDEVSF